MKAADYQIDTAGFIFERDSSMVFARPGTGKTLPTLMAMQDWRETKAAKRVLVSAPLRVAHNVWRQERNKWGIPLTMSLITGETVDKAAAIAAKTDVLITNHAMLGKVLASDHGCDALVIDELSKFRHHAGPWQKTVRNCGMPIRTGLTGSPAPNNYLGLYGMARAVGLDLFGHNFDKWKRKHFYPTDYEAHNWALFPGAPGDEIFDVLKPYVKLLGDDLVELPPIVRPPMETQLPDELVGPYREMRKTFQLTDEQIVASNAGVMTGKLRQIAAGFIYDNKGKPVLLSQWRLDILEELIDEMQGEPLLVMYEWVEQMAMLKHRWPSAAFMGQGSATADEEIITRWNKRELPILFMHPAGAGHGLNMADGGNSVAWLQPPHDNEFYEQSIGRLRRRDQPNSHVYSYEIVAVDTLDGAVRARLDFRAAEQDKVWKKLA